MKRIFRHADKDMLMGELSAAGEWLVTLTIALAVGILAGKAIYHTLAWAGVF